MGVFGTNPAQSLAGLGAAQRIAARDNDKKKAEKAIEKREVERAADAVEIADSVKKAKEDQPDNPRDNRRRPGQDDQPPTHLDLSA